MLLMSPMMFDAPGSTENSAVLFAFYSLLAFPVVTVISIALAWIFYSRNKLKLSLIISFLPFISMMLFIYGLSKWN